VSRELVRCAIYTRVSTENGLDQEFNSLDAQYEASSAYIKSQAHAGWVQVKTRYDDGGFSGGSTDRPALQSLLEDIRARKIDVIVVYKVDRLTRSLADFAKLVELFDGHRVSFVSVTQQFNTTTSMGRLTLNVLLSFAQFEREVTSERIRDKVAASKKKGIWVGGPLPLGYVMENGKVAVVPEEAERVRHIFARYLELGSVRTLMRDLVIIDDLLKPNDAHSEAARTRSIEWYRSTLVTRPDDKMAARIVVVMQRVHEEDLVGYLLEQDGFEDLNLPAIAQSEASYELGAGGVYRRQKGELLHPSHEPAEVLRDLKNVWPAPSARGFYGILNSLRQRIRSHEQAHGQDGYPHVQNPKSMPAPNVPFF
jgi:DNA invertase Pin-like site-specific DNA recombinase